MGKVIERGGISQTSSTNKYYISVAPVATPVDTGVTIAELKLHTQMTMSLIVEVAGVKYIIYNTVTTNNLDNPLFEGVRVSRVAEFTVGRGDVSFEMWVQAGTIWWDYDFDGAGKTFVSCSMEGVDFIV